MELVLVPGEYRGIAEKSYTKNGLTEVKKKIVLLQEQQIINITIPEDKIIDVSSFKLNEKILVACELGVFRSEPGRWFKYIKAEKSK